MAFDSNVISRARPGLAKGTFVEPEMVKQMDRVDQAFRNQIKAPMKEGILKDFNFTAPSQTKIPHGLSGRAVGFIVCDQSANAIIWHNAANDSDSAIAIEVSAAVRVKLWIWR